MQKKSTPLPAEIRTLIHHVELNKSGWWERTIDCFVSGILWESGKALSFEDIAQKASELGVPIDNSILRKSLEKAASGPNRTIIANKNTYKLSEASIRHCDKIVDEVTKIESDAKNLFFDCLKELGCELDATPELWQKFDEEFVYPLIGKLGASTYQLITGNSNEFAHTSGSAFFTQFPAESRISLQKATEKFFTKNHPTLRAYLLKQLNMFFCMEAGSLPKAVLDKVSRINSSDIKLNFFVDTNFLFSILGLHDNPANEVALLLHKIGRQISKNVSIKFYVLPQTLEEAKNVIQSQIVDINLSPDIACYASKEAKVSGIIKKYAQEVSASGSRISAEEYFRPYITNLLLIAREKNIEIFNEKTDILRESQQVIDDILSQIEYEKSLNIAKPKSYKPLEHDIVLWHFVKERRQAYCESPLDAQYWIVTLDNRFIRFDESKQHGKSEHNSVCIHPSTLVQLLQFWVPQTAELENALLSSLTLPFFLHEFTTESEGVTVKILNALSRYENIEDLTEETITKIVVNDAIRGRFKSADNINKQVDLIREAVLVENARLRTGHDEQLKEIHRNIQALESSNQSLRDAHLAVRQKAEQDLAAQRAQFEQQIRDRDEADRIREQRALDASRARKEMRNNRIRQCVGILTFCSLYILWKFGIDHNYTTKFYPLNAIAISIAIISLGLALLFYKKKYIIGCIAVGLEVVLNVLQVTSS